MRLPFRRPILALATLLLVAFPLRTHAAGIFFGTEAPQVDVGAEILIGVFMDTEKDSINAVEGFIDYPVDRLKPILIMDADSIVTPWLQRPALTPDGGGRIRFAGIIPGGYAGPRGVLFFVVFQTLSEGDVMIASSDERLLMNDGNGTAASLHRFPMKLTIQAGAANPTILLPKDTTPPEAFVPVIAQDPNAFDGKWFVSFLTQDKGSGIDHYEMRESWPSGHWRATWDAIAAFTWRDAYGSPAWRRVESPSVLDDQALRHDIDIKAFDRVGNSYIGHLVATHGPAWYENGQILGILIVSIAACIVWVRRFLWKTKPSP